MNPDELRRSIERLARIPSPSSSLDRILALASDTESDITQLAAGVEADPAVTARVLRLANSAYFGVARGVDTVGRAILVVGYNNVLSLAACAALAPAFQGEDSILDRSALWLHSCAVAEASRIAAGHLQFDPATAHVAGLLHDLGILVLSEVVGKSYGTVLEEARRSGEQLIVVERERLGTDHATAAGFLFEHWKLPAAMIAGVLYHHGPSGDGSGLAALIALSEDIAARAGFLGVTDHEPTGDTPRALLDALDLEHEHFEKLVAEFEGRRAGVELLARAVSQ